MALVDDFKARFSEFATAVVDQFMPILEPVYPVYYAGDYTDPLEKEIILNLLAHLLTMETTTSKAGTNGAALSKTVGNVSVTYGAASEQSVNRDFFGGTKYGQRFLLLISGRRGGVFV